MKIVVTPRSFPGRENEAYRLLEKKGMELTGKTIGIIGLGNIGKEVARMAHGIGMKAIGQDPYVKSKDIFVRKYKIQLLDIKEILAEADVEINKIEDASGDSSTWRAHRQALRDVTEIYKDGEGYWKESVESIDIDAFVFPAKP